MKMDKNGELSGNIQISANRSVAKTPDLLEGAGSLDALYLPVVEEIEVDDDENIEFSAPDQQDTSQVLSEIHNGNVHGIMESNTLGQDQVPPSQQEKLVEIGPVQILDNGDLLTGQQISEADVVSLADFSFPDESQVPGQIIHTIPTDIDILQQQTRSKKKKSPKGRAKKLKQEEEDDNILPAKMHRKNKDDDSVYTVPVGLDLKRFLAAHPLVRGLYLNRGKRDVKRNLVTIQRHNNAVDKGSWQRGHLCHERNRLDDHFVPTVEGKERISLIEEKRIRDEYVVNWYLWCPGHGNCQRKCGGYGTCEPGI